MFQELLLLKIIKEEPERDPETGKKKLLIEIDEDDIIIIDQSVRKVLQTTAFDKDDNKYIVRLNHVKEISHKAWTLLHPS